MLGNSLVAAQLAASQEGLSSMSEVLRHTSIIISLLNLAYFLYFEKK
jgi:hypothetical protein